MLKGAALQPFTMRFTRPFGVGPRYSGGADSGRADAETTDRQDALGVDSGLVASCQHRFIARALAFPDEPRAEPPHGRIEPEYDLTEQVNRVSQIVAAPKVTELVSQDGSDLLARELLRQALWQQQQRT